MCKLEDPPNITCTSISRKDAKSLTQDTFKVIVSYSSNESSAPCDVPSDIPIGTQSYIPCDCHSGIASPVPGMNHYPCPYFWSRRSKFSTIGNGTLQGSIVGNQCGVPVGAMEYLLVLGFSILLFSLSETFWDLLMSLFSKLYLSLSSSEDVTELVSLLNTISVKDIIHQPYSDFSNYFLISLHLLKGISRLIESFWFKLNHFLFGLAYYFKIFTWSTSLLLRLISKLQYYLKTYLYDIEGFSMGGVFYSVYYKPCQIIFKISLIDPSLAQGGVLFFQIPAFPGFGLVRALISMNIAFSSYFL